MIRKSIALLLLASGLLLFFGEFQAEKKISKTNQEQIEKYLPWSKELPEEILNFQGEYKEMAVDNL